MKILRGSPALSVFRTNQLLLLCKNAHIPVKKIYAEYIYFIDIKINLDVTELKKLRTLLKYGQTYIKHKKEGKLLVVTPKPGLRSSWSSKSTDIAHNCGLYKIKCIERGIAYYIKTKKLIPSQWNKLSDILYDRMTEKVFKNFKEAQLLLFDKQLPKKIIYIDIIGKGYSALESANISLGLALNKEEINYIFKTFTKLKRNPSDVELYMFSQTNSEHCRHKIFNSYWIIDGKRQDKSLFEMIKNTLKKVPEYILSAYKDNSAIMEGSEVGCFFPNTHSKLYEYHQRAMHILMKVETHNHPTAISPWPGAATGSGGEIRDEGATGRGAKPKFGLVGFSVSNLFIPGFQQPWEDNLERPKNIVSALNIIIEGPLGSASFNNEFGRPILTGYFRTYEEKVHTSNGLELRGYHKPIMLSGGIGNIFMSNIKKNKISIGAKIIVLGGPGMNIGLGGSTASSMTLGQLDNNCNYSSVQRDNPEMERRCQEVIDRCWQQEEKNPILFIHDVGAGGLSNAIPELIKDGHCGGYFQLRNIPNEEFNMSPLEIWCNESQERYIIAIIPERLSEFHAICVRERAPYAVIGEATEELYIKLNDNYFKNDPVNLSLDFLFNKTPKILRQSISLKNNKQKININNILLKEAIKRVLHLPVVAEKTFLITINDRSVTGMVVQDQMVGPWQIPVANCAVTTASFDSYYGEAISIGERAPIALLNFSASARIAVGEALTNLAATHIGDIKRIKLSANWIGAADHPGDDAGLYQAVKTLSNELCPELGLTISVGKDSMSMKTCWNDGKTQKEITAPLSPIITAFTRIEDVRATVTPQLQTTYDNAILLIDLGNGNQALGATALSQVYRQIGDKTADVHDTKQLVSFFYTIQQLVIERKLLAYHDRSDGGLLVTLAEMAFSGHCSIDIDISILGNDVLSSLFNEELGSVIQIKESNKDIVISIFRQHGLEKCLYFLGKAYPGDNFIIRSGKNILYQEKRTTLRMWWAQTSWQIKRLRDNPESADQEYQSIQDNNNPGLTVTLSFDPTDDITAPFIAKGIRPKVAVLREQGTNSHIEMAAAFNRAGFDAIDVHMRDIFTGIAKLNDFHVLVACGGFSYGDVLGSGEGWAKSILLNQRMSDEFEQFFNRSQTLALGVCNGCQMMSHLKKLIPGTNLWPQFLRNKSERFESRFSLVEITNSPSLLLQDMSGSQIPITIAHGEGLLTVRNKEHLLALEQSNLVTLRYIDNYGRVTENYPANPNGSPHGITGLTNKSGQVTIIMPHPERVFRSINYSWYPKKNWHEDGPWMRLFRNARKQLG